MPQIPIYDGPQVGLRPVQYDQASPDSFGAVQGRQIAGLGQGAMQAGQALDVINEREVSTQVFNAEAAAKEAFTKWQQEVTMTRQGEAAKGLAKDAEGWWSKAGQDYGKDLSPQAQRMLQKAFTQQGVASLGQMAHFENAQLESALQTSKAKTVASSYDRAVADPSTVNIDVQRGNIVAALEKAGDRNRMAPEAWTQHVAENVTAMHARVFNSLAATNPTAAREYFKKYDSEFVGEQRAQVLTQLKSVTAAVEGRAGARDAIAAATQGLGQTDPFPTQKINAVLTERFKGDEAALDQARHELTVQATLWADNSAKMIGDAGEKATAAITKGMSFEQFKATGALNGVSEGDTAKIKLAYDAQQLQLFSQNVQRRELVMRDQELRGAPKMWELMSNPAQLAAMTDQQVRSLYTEVGFNNAAKLAEARKELITSASRLQEAKIDADTLKTLASSAGLDVDAKKGESAIEMVRLRDQVEAVTRSEQAAKNRPLTDPEKREIMRQVIDDKAITGWFGSTKPIAALSEADRKEAKVQVVERRDDIYGTTNVVHTMSLASIPSGFRANALATLPTFGVHPTETNIAQAWFDAPAAEKQKWINKSKQAQK